VSRSVLKLDQYDRSEKRTGRSIGELASMGRLIQFGFGDIGTNKCLPGQLFHTIEPKARSCNCRAMGRRVRAVGSNPEF
jgi:hypothetical protein